MHHLRTGQLGEDIAVEYLIKKGFTLIERNFRKSWGEIDIIAKDSKGVLVFVEVKTILQQVLRPRTQDRVTQDKLRQSLGNTHDKFDNENTAICPEDNLTKSKLIKVKRTAQLYAGHFPQYINDKFGLRVDLVAITMPNVSSSFVEYKLAMLDKEETLNTKIMVKHDWMFHVKHFLQNKLNSVLNVSHFKCETLINAANSEPMLNNAAVLTNLLKISVINHYENL